MVKIQDIREPAVPQVKDSLTEFQKSLESMVETLDSWEEPLSDILTSQSKKLTDQYQEEAEKYFPKKETEEEIPSLEGYLWDYFLPEKFKDLLLLFRDCLLQEKISEHLLAEKKINSAKIDDLNEKSKHLLKEALLAVQKEMTGEIQVLKTKEGALDRKFEDVLHLKNPWGVYKAQFKTLNKQMDEIIRTNDLMKETIMTFSLIRSNLERMGFEIRRQNRAFLQKARESEELISQLEQSGEIDKALKWLEDVLEDLLTFEGKQDHQVRILEDWLESLKSFLVPIASLDGALVTKNIDFKRTTTKWLDYFILPDIIELWEDQESMISRIKHVISQIRGSLTIAKQSEGIQSFKPDHQAVSKLMEGIRDNSTRANNLLIHIDDTIKKDFYATSVYQDKEFLKVPLQTSFGTINNRNKNLGQRIKSTWQSFLQVLGRKYRETKEKSAHEKLEIAMQVIENRTHDIHPDHYHTLFLTKNFVGDLFLVPRKEIEDQLDQVVVQWKSGKSRSILLTGAPLCGKSTMAEHLSKVSFQKNTILLSPETDLVVEGRKFRTSYSLKEAFDFIKRSLQNTSPLILVDDLNLWRDQKTSLLQNVKELMNFISTHGKRTLVLATLPEIMVRHLDTRLQFSASFTNYFNLDTANIDEIYKAIMLRHGASHKSLQNANDQELTDREINRKIVALSKKFDNNIGAVLQAWTFITDVKDEETILIQDRSIQLNDFLSTTEQIILKHCLLFGFGTELEFKSFFPDRFETEFKPVIRKLLNIHVLSRDERGRLVVEDLLKQDVYTLLKYKEILQ